MGDSSEVLRSVALEHVARRGCGGASQQPSARVAGLSTSSVPSHFEHTDSLFAAALRPAVDRVRAQFVDGMTDSMLRDWPSITILAGPARVLANAGALPPDHRGEQAWRAALRTVLGDVPLGHRAPGREATPTSPDPGLLSIAG